MKEEKVDFTKFTFNCRAVQGGSIPYSNIIKVNPIYTGLFDIMCCIFFVFVRMFKNKWRRLSTKSRIRNVTTIVLLVLTIIDTIFSIIKNKGNILSNLSRPIMVIVFFSTIRSNFKTACRDLILSIGIFLFIFVYVFFFSLVGYFMFRNTQEGEIYYDDLSDSIYNMFILLTTANFPDIMLPAYEVNYFFSIFYILFLLFGLYFIINLLLAKVFDNYKKSLEESAENRSEKRRERLESYFDMFDDERKGFLNIMQAKRFFSVVL